LDFLTNSEEIYMSFIYIENEIIANSFVQNLDTSFQYIIESQTNLATVIMNNIQFHNNFNQLIYGKHVNYYIKDSVITDNKISN